MAEYRVIHTFVDTQNHHHIYHTGDRYPRDGKPLDEGRIAYLAGTENRIGEPVIEIIEQTAEEKPEPKPKRGRRKKDAD